MAAQPPPPPAPSPNLSILNMDDSELLNGLWFYNKIACRNVVPSHKPPLAVRIAELYEHALARGSSQTAMMRYPSLLLHRWEDSSELRIATERYLALQNQTPTSLESEKELKECSNAIADIAEGVHREMKAMLDDEVIKAFVEEEEAMVAAESMPQGKKDSNPTETVTLGA